jgi:hypothetical protein
MKRHSLRARARRISIDSEILYSEIEKLGWCAGRVENVSSSGVLFEGKHLVPAGTAIEMTLSVPSEVLGIAEQGASAQVYCTAVIVRTDAGSGSGEPLFRMGTRITSWQRLPMGQSFR